jgi:protein involved in temperature-dependent protein secretion
MGIIRKSLAVSTLGGIKYTSKREATTKNASAQARLAKAETKAVKAQGKTDAGAQRQARVDATGTKWEPVVAAITAGEASWDDLSRMQRLSMPIGYQMKCKAAMRRQSAV